MNVQNAPLHLLTNNIRRLTILGTGNVGIGTTAPSTRLHTVSTGAAAPATTGTTPSTGTIARFETTTSNGVIDVGNDGGNTALWLQAYNKLDLSTNWRLLLNPNGGNVGIGTASPSNYGLVVNVDANNAAKIGILTTGRSGTEYPSVGYNVRYTGTAFSYTYDGTDTASLIRFQAGKVETFTAASGTAGNAISFTTGPYVAQGGTSWSAGSDVRLKKNIKPISVLDKLEHFRAVAFDWKETGKHDLGVIAQEMYEVFPEVVDKGDDDLNAQITSDSEGKWGVQYDKLGALALQAAKELKADNDNLRTELKAANDNYEDLRREIEALKSAR